MEIQGVALEAQSLLPRAYYAASVDGFLSEPSDSIIGELTRKSEGSVVSEQVNAWVAQIGILRESLRGISGTLLLEFNIPRMGRRIDAVLVCETVLFVLEFKVGETVFNRQDIEQVWDYALDLKNFHKASHTIPILPVLIATEAKSAKPELLDQREDMVWFPSKTNANGLRALIDLALASAGAKVFGHESWGDAPYHPTPTIIEAARSLYSQHSVDEIARHDAGAKNLAITSLRIESLVDEARQHGHKLICFVTGVPGAGKTLVGLNVATRRGEQGSSTHAVFLSGNTPLVDVLCEALTRDEVARRKLKGERVRKSIVGEGVKAFIQNVHHFRDEGLRDAGAPFEHVVIFDEAQRAWNRDQTIKFMKTKKQRLDFDQSEPEFLLSYLDRHDDWAVVICLVGGGQEINTGEAGIAEWLDAVQTCFPEWQVYISPELTDSEYAAGRAIEVIGTCPNVHFDKDLHLAVSMRSFRAENVSTFVKAVLDCETGKAQDAFAILQDRYPIRLTRDIKIARQWTKRQARGTERYGLVASSGAQRLKPHAIDVRVAIDPVIWFLNDRDDTRSSFYLEDVATEFQVQGLELDWTCVTWDGDFRYSEGGWRHFKFSGCNWQNVHKQERQNYLRNAYRVLLTRARQGMVIFVPEGDHDDLTRKPEFYDATFNYLKGLGIPVIG